jgi:adenylate cyclase
MKFKKIEKKVDNLRKEKILLVDDEEPNLRQLKAMLDEQYDVVTALNGKEGLEKSKDPNIGVIITDQRMPGMTGTEMFQELEKIKHSAVRVILTGYADLSNVIDAVNQCNVYKYLGKPIDGTELLNTVRNAHTLFETNRYTTMIVSQLKALMEENAQLKKQLGDNTLTTINLSELEKTRNVSLAVMNLDLRGFSKYMKEKPAELVIQTLQEIYLPIYKEIYAHAGIVDKHMGDGLMAVFGLDGSGGKDLAVPCLEKIIKSFPHTYRSLTDPDGKILKLGGGLAHGSLVMGMLGDDNRSELAIIGEAANLSARLQEYTKILLQGDEYKTSLSLGISDSLTSQNTNFKNYKISERPVVRDFEKLTEIFIVNGGG